MTTFTFATSGVHTPILLSAHAAYSASRTLVNAGVDQVVPFIVQRPDTPTQHDITALFPSYAAADAFATALRSEGLCAVSIADALRTNLAPDPHMLTVPWTQAGSTGVFTHASFAGPNGLGYFRYQLDTATTASPMVIGLTGTGTSGVAVAPGQDITLSSYWRCAPAIEQSQRYDLTWYDAVGTQISTNNGPDEFPGTMDPNTWLRVSHTFQAPPAAAYFQPKIVWSGTYVAGNILDVADVLLEAGTALLPFFSGAHSPRRAFGAAWTGPANASTSVLVPKGVQVEQFDGISSGQVRVQNTPGIGATEVQFTLTEVPA